MRYDPRNARFAPLVSVPSHRRFWVWRSLRSAAVRRKKRRSSFESQQAVSPTASLEYKVDSLKNETRRLKEQLRCDGSRKQEF